MLLDRIKIRRLLSFGPNGVDLEMRPLNVLIGPNGSGKSNFVEVLNLLHFIPGRLSSPILAGGGMGEWKWKGTPPGSAECGSVDLLVKNDREGQTMPLRHRLELDSFHARVLLDHELIEQAEPFEGETRPWRYYSMRHGEGILHDWAFIEGGTSSERRLDQSLLDPTQSILAQIKDRSRYVVFDYLQRAYESVRVYRDWTFGPRAAMRSAQKPDGPTDFMGSEGENFVSILSSFNRVEKNRLVEELGVLYEEIVDIRTAPSGGGTLRIFVEEEGGIEIPAERLSDGTLRFLFLLAILIDPNPPRLVVIEEPELGLHPDVVARLAQLLIEASQRTQLVVTTHSRMLVEALGDEPESIVVCRKEEGETRMERLCAEDLEEWLSQYSLGELWSKGEIGGNRW